MPYTVFYAWQMDRDKKLNRWFIHRAAKNAITSVVAGLELEDAPAVEDAERRETDPDESAEIELDHDTKGEPGTPAIAETILNKIENCGVFIADVTLVGEVETADGRKKKTPNGNVLIELGAAIKSVGWERIILVMNRAFGSAEDLPFDLKHRAIRVGYELERSDDPEKTKKCAELTKQLADNLRELHRKGIITRRDEQQRQVHEGAMNVRATEVEAERQAFEAKVAANQYERLKADMAVLVLSVIPATKVKLPFLRSQELIFRRFLQPINYDRCPIQQRPRSMISLTPPIGSNSVQTEAAELRESGSLLAVWNIMAGQDSFTTKLGPQVDTTKPWLLHICGIDERVNEWLRQSLSGLKELGVGGPWYVGVSLLKTRNCSLSPSTRGDGFDRSYHVCGEDHMYMDTVRLAEETDLNVKTAIDALMLPVWKQMWRHCNFNGVPRQDALGDVVEWRE